jgi:hypothetical protein
MMSASTTPMSELDDENEVHQHHGDTECSEDGAEHLPLILHLATGDDLVALRQRELGELRLYRARDVAERSFDVRPDGDDALAVEMFDLRRSRTRRDIRDLPEWYDAGAGRSAREHNGYARNVGGVLAHLCREPDTHIASLTRGVDPVARVHPGECRTKRGRDLSNADAE